ncbi:DNA polymerase [Trichonephila clavipes]|nr:DNA polymerase [Trichonephila clavipes]
MALSGSLPQINLGVQDRDPSQGLVIWVETLNEAFYKCRDPKKYSISRKTKNIDEYKSTTYATVKMLQKYPEKSGEYIEYTYSRADIAAKETLKWIMDADEIQEIWNAFRSKLKLTFCLDFYSISIQDVPYFQMIHWQPYGVHENKFSVYELNELFKTPPLL